MVTAVRRGRAPRAVARDFGVSLATVQHWIRRARGQRLDRVDWSSHPPGPPPGSGRTPRELEDLLLSAREHLRQESPLGEYGAAAVRAYLTEQGVKAVPSVRTIGRVFERRGALDAHARTRRKAPPAGWYLPDVAQQRAELDAFDIVEGLKIKNGPLIEVLNGVSLHGGLVCSWPQPAAIGARQVVEALIEHWRSWGLPAYAQFDNDTVFQGAHQHKDVISRVMRLCLSLSVVPVFVPVGEYGFQAAIEGYNGKWQAKVWARHEHTGPAGLSECSQAYVAAHRQRRCARREAAPERTRFPADWTLQLQHHPADYAQARLVYIRRTDQSGYVNLLGHRFLTDPLWRGRLVRADVWLAKGVIRVHALRRRAPQEQPVLSRHAYRLPRRPFRE
jgi:transposase